MVFASKITGMLLVVALMCCGVVERSQAELLNFNLVAAQWHLEAQTTVAAAYADPKLTVSSLYMSSDMSVATGFSIVEHAFMSSSWPERTDNYTEDMTKGYLGWHISGPPGILALISEIEGTMATWTMARWVLVASLDSTFADYVVADQWYINKNPIIVEFYAWYPKKSIGAALAPLFNGMDPNQESATLYFRMYGWDKRGNGLAGLVSVRNDYHHYFTNTDDVIIYYAYSSYEPSVSPSNSASPSVSASPSESPSPSASPSESPSPSASPSVSASPSESPSPSASPSESPSPSASPSVSQSSSQSPSPSASPSESPSPSASPSVSASPSQSPSPSASPSVSPSPSNPPSASRSPSRTRSPSPSRSPITPSPAPSKSPSRSASKSRNPTPSVSSSPSISASRSPAPSRSPSRSASRSKTPTPSVSSSPSRSASRSPSRSKSPKASSSMSRSASLSGSVSRSAYPSRSPKVQVRSE